VNLSFGVHLTVERNSITKCRTARTYENLRIKGNFPDQIPPISTTLNPIQSKELINCFHYRPQALKQTMILTYT